MSYTALYRKFRPQDFEDVKGQDPIVTTLKNQIEAGRIGHAYLFCGTRGTGKTTIAKIFAKAVNCEHPVGGSPCGECRSCRAAAAGTAMNIIEIDAASNNGVDSIREIREEVAYRPAEGRYKVYIIDEVHMLSPGAFNALLKTLEEPPSYVIFILATTEAHKIPVTILSRCQRYDFRRISVDTICGRLKEILEKEQVAAEEKAVRYIAKAADGAMRDALSLLDQCIAFYLGQELTYDRVLEVLGAVDTEVFGRLFESILDQDVKGVISLVERLIAEGRELGQFVVDFTWYLRNLLLLKGSDDMEDVLDLSSENLEQMKGEALRADENALIRYIRIFSELSSQIKYSSQKRVLLEVALIKLCRPQMEQDTGSLAERVRQLEEKLEQGIATAYSLQGMPASGAAYGVPPGAAPGMPPGAAAGFPPGAVSGMPPGVVYGMMPDMPPGAASGASPGNYPSAGMGFGTQPAGKLPRAVPEDVQEAVKSWRAIIASLPNPSRKYLSKARLTLGSGDELVLVFEDSIAADFCAREEKKKQLERAIADHIGKEVSVLVKENDTGQRFEDSYEDLEQIIRMDITYEDEWTDEG